MNIRFCCSVFGALVFAVSLLGVGCTPEETTATTSYTTSAAAVTSVPGMEVALPESVAPQSTAVRQTTTTYSPSALVAPPPVTFAPVTSVTRQTTTTYASPDIVVSPAVSVTPPATVRRRTTTTYDSYGSSNTVTVETVRRPPAVTTTYEQKTYREDEAQ